jgi:YHS domain-containing protein
MLRYILLLLLVVLVTRAVSRVIGGVVQGLGGTSGRARGNVPTRGVPMVRDPICGTYVVADRALALTDGSRHLFFCSAGCREKYRARPSTTADGRQPAGGPNA